MRAGWRTRTQRAFTVPFDNSTNGFLATDVQAAIEESRQDAIDNDRYPIQASYIGAAVVGRYLEIFPGEGSDTGPLLAPDNSIITAVTVQAQSATTGAIRIYNVTTATVLYDASYGGATQQIYLDLALGGISSGDSISFSVITAAINKPKLRVWFQTVPEV